MARPTRTNETLTDGWIADGEAGVVSYAAFKLELFDPDGSRVHVRPFATYAEAAEFVRANFWFNGVDYWDGERWVFDVEGEVLAPSGPEQKRRLSGLAGDLDEAAATLRRVVLLLGREELTGDALGVGRHLDGAADVVVAMTARLRAATRPGGS